MEEIEQSLELIKHRGPDERGTYVSPDGRVGLGHVRLSIIDVPGGHQPMSDDLNGVHCVVAGELYDYAELRAHLEAKGVQFKTDSDSEVVLGLYAHYGLDLFPYLRGEFTFALYDLKRGRLVVARDRFGIKPLYYTMSQGRWIFANEIKAFLGYGWKAKWDRDSIMHLGEFGDQRTVFQGVSKLAPGHCIILDRGDRFRMVSYWDHSFPSNSEAATNLQTGSEQNQSPRDALDNAINTVRQLLVDSVRSRLRSDVPLAVYLSGGLDSASIAGIATHLLREKDPQAKVDVFTLGFPEKPEFDEGPRASRMAAHIGATMHLVEPTEKELVDELETVIYHCEAPVYSLTAAGKLILSRTVRREGFKVVLTGEGSDEIFAGYNFVMADFLRQEDHVAGRMFGIPIPTTQERTEALAAFQSQQRQDLGSLSSVSDFDDASSVHNGDRHKRISAQALYETNLGGLMPPSIATLALPSEFYTPQMSDTYGPTDVYSTVAENIPPGLRARLASGDCHALHGQLYVTHKSVLANGILNLVGDRTEMVNSIEGRPPFLDHKLVEYVNSLAPSVKIRPFQLDSTTESPSRSKWTFTEKWILREAVKPFITPEIYSTKKSQYNVSLPSPKGLSPLQRHMQSRITRKAVEMLGIFSWEAVERTLRAFLERRREEADGGLDRNGRRLIYVLSFLVLRERFGVEV